MTEDGGDIFVKENPKGEGAKKMFDGEFCSLQVIILCEVQQLKQSTIQALLLQALWATGVVRVPKPLKVLQRYSHTTNELSNREIKSHAKNPWIQYFPYDSIIDT